ncbi:MAG TPA: recombinase family protein [Pirellulaceae bacterium]|nr:recombinase family protein [Pirellulaceae bacterium]
MRIEREMNGRGVFYSRDSGGKHEQSPAEYVGWTARKAKEHGVRFDGTAETINEMIRSGQPVRGDIFFDYCVPGNELSRPALDALQTEIRRDPSISHVFIPRRDRLARPDDPLDAIKLESEMRRQGITIVLMNKVLPPLRKGQRAELAEGLTAFIEYDQSGRFREQLAEKMIPVQLALARLGFSAGGRAPFGFRRTLARDDGSVVRQLTDGEIVRQAGHHVIWLPGPDSEIGLIRRIVEMLEIMPASQVASRLNNEGIPSPDAGRYRTDNGVKHRVSGVWHQSTIVGIGRNKLLAAVVTYGKRSLGDQRRISPESPTGARELDASDLRSDGKAKVIRNPVGLLITTQARFEPLIPAEQHDNLQQILDARGGTQRGKPRSRDPEKNPLGGRVFDLGCSWPMYRVPYGKSFRYKCGLYQQSHAQQCHHNHVDGLAASHYVLAEFRKRFLKPGMMDRLEQKLRERLAAETSSTSDTHELTNKQTELAEIRTKLQKASENLALAQSPTHYQAISKVFDDLHRREVLLAEEASRLERVGHKTSNLDELAAAMAVVGQLTALASDADNLGDLGRLFARLNAQLFLAFHSVRKKKRIEQKLRGGVLTFGTAPAPIEKYAGPTARRSLTARNSPEIAIDNDVVSGREEKSLGNISRGDRI